MSRATLEILLLHMSVRIVSAVCARVRGCVYGRARGRAVPPRTRVYKLVFGCVQRLVFSCVRSGNLTWRPVLPAGRDGPQRSPPSRLTRSLTFVTPRREAAGDPGPVLVTKIVPESDPPWESKRVPRAGPHGPGRPAAAGAAVPPPRRCDSGSSAGGGGGQGSLSGGRGGVLFNQPTRRRLPAVKLTRKCKLQVKLTAVRPGPARPGPARPEPTLREDRAFAFAGAFVAPCASACARQDSVLPGLL